MSYIKNAIATANIYAIKYEEPQPRLHRTDRVDERDIVGSERTMVTRLGFGSKEITMTLIMYPDEWAKLDAMRGTEVEFEGETYDLTVRSLAQYDTRFYEVEARLKRI